MVDTEGVIQYQLIHQPGPLPPDFDPTPLSIAFRACRSRGLIGQSDDRYGGYAYGNLSQRVQPGFVISGTQTGGLADLDAEHLAWVTDFDAKRNQLTATGPARPSSEAMSHGEVYQAAPNVAAVIHVHAPDLWHRAVTLGLPITDTSAGYGTPAMAREVHRLLEEKPDQGVLAMGGHEDGIIAYAADLPQAWDLLLAQLIRLDQP